ncbi:type II toxin-antitoxin system HicA family toxin [Pseudomonas putida]|uniref:type II toxin-antitoxin system HicA family toxin n=1 Tax=Pseudomonas putida TaxID=303 RepID=UPI0023646772|nr:type II toxin-antitoxin system HicA family toxin [Pseudomonas putida]MDD1966503.1 type II toxin-antitoxin system HicA family toxin [Pseudomonas putida]
MNSRELIAELEAAGWTLQRIRGSHHIFTHPRSAYSIPVPRPKKDLPLGTVKSIRRRAWLIPPEQA